MRSRVVGRTYRINGSLDLNTQAVEITFKPVDDSPISPEEQLILANASHRCAPGRADFISGGADEDLKYRLMEVKNLEVAITAIRRIAHSADGRLINHGFDLCSVLHESRVGIAGIDDIEDVDD